VRQRSLIRFGAALLVGSLALTACGNRDDDGSEPNNSSSSTGGNVDKPTVKIGVIAPLSGSLSAIGLGIQHSVDLAIAQVNEDADFPFKVEIEAEDDTATPDVGQQAASTLASDEDVIGVVGPLNSSVAQTVAPVLNEAGIVEISPANTNPTLTMGQDWTTNPQRVWPTYFRTCATDNAQGRYAAGFVFNDLGFKNVAIVHDKKTYGQGLTAVFQEEFEKLGGTITTLQTINPDETDYSAVVTTVKATNPQLVYYGGEYPQAGPLSSQMVAAGLDVPLMGGDGIYDPTYIELAGAAADGDYATSVGAPTEELETAAAFRDAYEAANYPDPYGAYGGYSYDSANAILNALKTVDPTLTGDDLRAAVLAAVQNINFEGATGTVSFDQYGDTSNRTLTVYQVEGTEWKALKTDAYKG
jgi:branched-chain amino acid transport system substrate-binding protein